MDFILSNENQPPILDSGGVLNLQDWRAAGSLQASARYPVKLPGGQLLELSNQPELPDEATLALSDEDLSWVDQQGYFPVIRAQMFLRGLVNDVDAIAPMLSFGSFFTQFSPAIKKIVDANLKKKDQAVQWQEYYAGSLFDFPIFSTVVGLLSEKNRADIGQAYFDMFTDVKYLSAKQLNALTLDQKVEVLKTTLSKHAGNDGKLDVAIALFGPDDEIPDTEAGIMLGFCRASTDAGRLMVCNGFANSYNNAYNVVATWIHLCIKENIGTNQSVWFQAATDLEVRHKFALAGEYIRNLRGTPIGLNQSAAPAMGGLAGGYRTSYANNQPIGL